MHLHTCMIIIGNLSPRFRSRINNSQLLLLALVAEFWIDRMLEPIVKDIRKHESVSISTCTCEGESYITAVCVPLVPQLFQICSVHL